LVESSNQEISNKWVSDCRNILFKKFTIEISPFHFQARNLEQKREWTLQLKRVILENYNAVIPSHARQLVMELGQNRTDGE